MAAQSFLLTRPATASARFAAALRAALGADIHVVLSPLMAATFLDVALPAGPFAAIILTSETGVEAARRISAERGGLPDLAFCVGDQTAVRAAKAGFRTRSADGNADNLVALIAAERPQGRLLHLRGRDSRGDIAARLNSAGSRTFEAIVYEQCPLALTPEAKALLAGPDPVILPVFSPRSADLLAQTGPHRAPLRVAALSPAVARHAEALQPVSITTAARPDAEAMLETVESLWVAGRQT